MELKDKCSLTDVCNNIPNDDVCESYTMYQKGKQDGVDALMQYILEYWDSAECDLDEITQEAERIKSNQNAG